jgi:hypothetical protein
MDTSSNILAGVDREGNYRRLFFIGRCLPRACIRSDPGEFLGQHADRLATGIGARESAIRYHHAKGGDEGRNTRARDQTAIN